MDADRREQRRERAAAARQRIDGPYNLGATLSSIVLCRQDLSEREQAGNVLARPLLMELATQARQLADEIDEDLAGRR